MRPDPYDLPPLPSQKEFDSPQQWALAIGAAARRRLRRERRWRLVELALAVAAAVTVGVMAGCLVARALHFF